MGIWYSLSIIIPELRLIYTMEAGERAGKLGQKRLSEVEFEIEDL